MCDESFIVRDFTALTEMRSSDIWDRATAHSSVSARERLLFILHTHPPPSLFSFSFFLFSLNARCSCVVAAQSSCLERMGNSPFCFGVLLLGATVNKVATATAAEEAKTYHVIEACAAFVTGSSGKCSSCPRAV